MSLQRTAVIGAGTMGNGIAQVMATSGCAVTLIDVDEAALARGRGTIEKSLAKLVSKEKITAADRDAALGRIATATNMKDAAGASLVVEAIVENLDAKRSVFQGLAQVVDASAILASNTSSISITELAAAVPNPERVIGMHFMNPVPLMKLVEIVRGLQTSDETTAAVDALSKELGKVPVTVNDYPGFISNRVLMPMINEAIYCLMEGVADEEAIDTIMKLGMAHPMGPLALADLIGLDVCLHIMQVLQDGLGDSKYRACPLLRNMVAAGKLGRKSGQGFYQYDA
ncbi:MAG: 3-hydroxybutyryl-CoA dehydrogenase [Gemmatimonadota bacterium]|nr:MAG: 3-hydroxybutyryl-CoA dehydrogenase [Gemmatimonadota bacterium]